MTLNPTQAALRDIRARYPELRERRVTETLVVARGAVAEVGPQSRNLLGPHVLLLSDPQTYAAGGRAVLESLRAANVRVTEFDLGAEPVATPEIAGTVAQRALDASSDGTPLPIIALGAGTVNDIAKTASHEAARPYISVGTALSMNGYTSAISALLEGGIKRTVPANPPVAVIIDLDICAAAPAHLTRAGFGDMLSKPFSEADWRLSHAIDDVPWHPAPGELLSAVFPVMIGAAPSIGRLEADAMASLAHAILLSGMAMAFAGVSSPASGGEHLISHYWDMGQYARGHHPFALHGTQVGVACCLVEPLHHAVATAPWDQRTVEAALSSWPSTADLAAARIRARHEHMPEATREGIVAQAMAKWRPVEAQRARLESLRARWAEVSAHWQDALLEPSSIRRALSAVGGATRPADVNPSLSDSLGSWLHVRDMRSRYTVLDFAVETGFGAGTRDA